MTNLSEFTFLSSDGKTQLHGMLWEPEGVAVRAVLQICHGVAERMRSSSPRCFSSSHSSAVRRHCHTMALYTG